MPPFQGLRGSRSYAADAIPKNWREGILRLYPNGGANGGAVLTAFSALLDSEITSDPEYNWWERGLPVREVFTAGGSAVVTTLAVSSATGGVGDPGKLFRKGYILQVVGTGGTGEKILVVADQTVGTTLPSLQRGFGETAAAIIPANAQLRVVGNANEEGASTGTPIAVDPTKQFNYTQIFRTPLHITRTAKKTRLRTEEAIVQAQIEALEYQAQDMEYAFLFGERLETTGAGGQPMRTTRGIVPWITTLAPGNVTTVTDGSMNEEELFTALEPIYRFGSTEKLWLCGSTALMALNRLAKIGSYLNLEAGDDVYGIRLRQLVTGLGDGYIRMHPLFNLYDDWRAMIVIIDLPHVKYRYIDDLMYLEHRQNPGDDALKNEWLAECGLEVHHAQTHGVIKNLRSAVAVP